MNSHSGHPSHFKPPYFKPLYWITAILTFLLLIWGNFLSSFGAGLACPDWPTCFGTFFPPVRFDVIMEWGHRMFAASVSMFFLISFALTWKYPERKARYQKLYFFLGALLLFQVILGGTTVLLELSKWVSSLHHICGTLFFSGLLLIACHEHWGDHLALINSSAPTQLKLLSSVHRSLGMLLIQILLGGLVRHSGAGLACPHFPNCIDSFFPNPLNWQSLIHFTHRWWGILTAVYLLVMVFSGLRDSGLSKHLKKILTTLGMITVIQVLFGIGTVYHGLSTATRSGHGLIGYALWATLFYLFLRTKKLQKMIGA